MVFGQKLNVNNLLNMWYKKYIDCYEYPFSKIPKERVNECKKRIDALQSNNPIASIVIIAYNESERLFSCLESLSNTKCKYPIEILGIDNNSIDCTSDIFKECGVKYFLESKQGHGHARNCGLYNAKGKYYLCMDSDIMYPHKYIEKMIDTFEKDNKNVAVNSRYGYISKDFMSSISIFIYESLRNINFRLKSIKRPEIVVRGAVFGFVTDLGKQVGGFRTNIKRGEDGSMALRLKEYGKIIFISTYKAKAITGFRSLEGDGSVFNAFKVRALKEFKNFNRYFYKNAKDDYKDDPSNLIK